MFFIPIFSIRATTHINYIYDWIVIYYEYKPLIRCSGTSWWSIGNNYFSLDPPPSRHAYVCMHYFNFKSNLWWIIGKTISPQEIKLLNSLQAAVVSLPTHVWALIRTIEVTLNKKCCTDGAAYSILSTNYNAHVEKNAPTQRSIIQL